MSVLISEFQRLMVETEKELNSLTYDESGPKVGVVDVSQVNRTIENVMTLLQDFESLVIGDPIRSGDISSDDWI